MRSIARIVTGLALTLSASAQTLIHTSQSNPAQPPSGLTVVQAARASEFLDSIGVATHLDYLDGPYRDMLKVEALLLQSGIRNIRDGGTNAAAVSRLREMADHGVALTWVMDPSDGVAPNAGYWTAPPHYMLAPFLKTVLGTKNVRAIEVSNEIDIFYRNKRWYPGDSEQLNKYSRSGRYWGKYIPNLTRDTWQVMRSDPAFASIQVLGTSFGGASAGVPAGTFSHDTDAGTFHPYMYRGNSAVLNAQPYDSVPKYFVDSTQPSVYIDENPTAFERFDTPYKDGGSAKPMIATETGYYTGSDQYSISESAHARYIPRIFAENFRHGIPRSFVYEFLDEGDDGKMEHSFGLVRADLTPKPAYYALQSLIQLLSDREAVKAPTAKLTYSVAVTSNDRAAHLQYAHDLLLQKADGDLYLLVWHEISDANRTDLAGVAVKGTDIDVASPDLNVKITLPKEITKVTVYRYDAHWTLIPTPLTLEGGSVSTYASDKIAVLKLESTSRKSSSDSTRRPTTRGSK